MIASTDSNRRSPQECEQFIDISEDFGYEDALVSTPEGQVVRKDVRNNQRAMLENPEFTEQHGERALDCAPYEFEGRTAIGINELLRFYRYDPGQSFNWHQDFSFERDNGEASFYTFMGYLNDDCDGGETSFEDSYSEESFDDFQVKPKQGTALFFEHPIHHKRVPVRRGRKYVLRSDIMYARDEVDSYDEDADDW